MLPKQPTSVDDTSEIPEGLFSLHRYLRAVDVQGVKRALALIKEINGESTVRTLNELYKYEEKGAASDEIRAVYEGMRRPLAAQWVRVYNQRINKRITPKDEQALEEILELLVDAGIDINARNPDQAAEVNGELFANTALHDAIYVWLLNPTILLLSHGADPLLKSAKVGESAQKLIDEGNCLDGVTAEELKKAVEAKKASRLRKQNPELFVEEEEKEKEEKKSPVETQKPEALETQKPEALHEQEKKGKQAPDLAQAENHQPEQVQEAQEKQAASHNAARLSALRNHLEIYQKDKPWYKRAFGKLMSVFFSPKPKGAFFPAPKIISSTGWLSTAKDQLVERYLKKINDSLKNQPKGEFLDAEEMFQGLVRDNRLLATYYKRTKVTKQDRARGDGELGHLLNCFKETDTFIQANIAKIKENEEKIKENEAKIKKHRPN